ncbi:hypothetical protein G9A89_005323 [Geosiphon pyriformis]|nr:hypothetical protein G9A89_005323 [Geosiphon pyriformis]
MLSFNTLSDDNFKLVLLVLKFIGFNWLLFAKSHVLKKHSFEPVKSFALNIELSAVPDVNLCWAGLCLACCAKYKQLGHISDVCLMDENSGVYGKQVVTS